MTPDNCVKHLMNKCTGFVSWPVEVLSNLYAVVCEKKKNNNKSYILILHDCWSKSLTLECLGPYYPSDSVPR